MIPCPRLPVFIPAFAGHSTQAFSERGLVDGRDPASGAGLRAEDRDGQTVLIRKETGEVTGELVWLNPTRYDEAISLMDVWTEEGIERTKHQAYDTRAACHVDCWVYLAPKA